MTLSQLPNVFYCWWTSGDVSVVMNRAAMRILAHVPGALRNMLKNRIARLQGLYNIELIKWCQTLFQSGFCQLILPLAVYEISLPELVRLLNSLPIRWEYGIFVVLNHSFFITNEAEHLFMLLATWIPSLVKWLFKSFT